MRTPLSRAGAPLVLLALAGSPTAAQQRADGPSPAPPGSDALWGRLEPGRHAVGFRVLRLTDVSRPPFVGEAASRGRELAVFLWYPARRPAAATPLALGRYVDELGGGRRDSPGSSARDRGVRAFAGHAAELGGDSSALRAALPSLLALPTHAYLAAPPASGRHPVFLFPAYLTPATISILAEFVASHGYVVASTPLLGTFERTPDISTRGLETQAADLRFTLSAIDTLSFADVHRVAVGGIGINASGALALAMRDPRVRGLVSLEGGVTTEGELQMIRHASWFDATTLRTPILAVTAPHPDVDANRLDVYRYATRHLVHFSRMGEFWFTSWGMLETHVPGVIGSPPGDTKAGFEWGARYVRWFLNAVLKGDSSSAALLAGTPAAAGVPDDLRVTSETRRALPPPLPIAELTAHLDRAGVEGLRAFVDSRRPADPQPGTADQFTRLAGWLAAGRDPDWRARRSLAALRAELYPESVLAHYTLAVATRAAGDTAAAMTHFRAARERLATDPDPTLGPARPRLERAIREALGEREPPGA